MIFGSANDAAQLVGEVTFYHKGKMFVASIQNLIFCPLSKHVVFACHPHIKFNENRVDPTCHVDLFQGKGCNLWKGQHGTNE